MIPNRARRRRVTSQRQILSRKRLSSEDSDFLVRDYLERLDCPRALTSWLLYKYGEHHQLVHLGCDPRGFNDPLTFRAAYAATKFLSKCVGLKTGIDLEGVAIQSAEEAEHLNRSTNQVVTAIRDGRVSDLYGPECFRAIDIISGILGAIPEVFTDVGWSAGRTSSSFGLNVTGYHKYQSRADVTARSRLRAMRLVNGSPWWGASILQCDAPVSVLPRAFTISGGNTLLTVPKSAKTDRVICYEPHMNIRTQLAVGDHIRRRLGKYGVNLDDQSINRKRARLASLNGKMATIDLSMASDTLAREVVFELLPVDWACLLDDLRSHYTLWPDGTNRKNEKFSSMGNGFTFELESLVFYALCCAVTSNVSVYGDDLVVPTESFDKVARVLRAFGFKLNAQKSFSSGCFRESCGGDYFSGVDCTPVYLRGIPKTPSDVMKLHNQVRRFASVVPTTEWATLLRKWRTIYPGNLGPSSPSSEHHYRDDGETSYAYGDGHYHVNWDEARPRAARTWCWERRAHMSFYTGIDGWIYRTRVPYMVAREELERYAPAICVATGPKRSWNLLSAALRQVIKYKNIWGLTMEWPDVAWG